VRYASLSALACTEAALPGGAPSRFQRDEQVMELRLEKVAAGTVAMVHDVTAEVRHQAKLQRQREALLHEERMHAMGVLASGVAHDLNHVLNVMALRVATLRADQTLGGARRTLDGLARVVADGARIVARLQDLARKRRDRPDHPVDVAAILNGAVEMARSEADLAGVGIEADVPPLPLVRGSAAELAHVFGSLLLHAREETPEGGAIRVSARHGRGQVCVSISDGGPGLRDEDAARIFDPFSGVGGEAALGLSVAWGVMNRLGGSISATSGRGQGTTLWLNFPVALSPRLEAPLKIELARGVRRVLIVDDEQDNLEVLCQVLELEGQEVETARSGPQALARFERGEQFDLVLCDVGMPQMSGWSVAREIHRLAPETPVWMLTGWANEIGESDTRRQLVRGVLAKPLDLDQLRALLSTGEPAAGDAASALH
jgi:signal transduction histidine kinase/ActR/RegA family two-component response regulator